jgi:large subunit ribosomal protein L24|tara:strand:+ start:272 stop:646 length:375 start_codon:yes stop_codon:yes gene_type:complete
MLQLLWFDDIMTKRSKSLKLYFNTSNATISKRLSARVSTDLIEKYSRKTIRIRIGDTVKILTGQYKNIEGKITHVYTNENKISIEGVTREKLTGGTTPIKIHSSNVLITGLELKDKSRQEMLES